MKLSLLSLHNPIRFRSRVLLVPLLLSVIAFVLWRSRSSCMNGPISHRAHRLRHERNTNANNPNDDQNDYGDEHDNKDDVETRSFPYRPHAQDVRREVRPNVATRARLRQGLARGKRGRSEK